MTGGGKEEIIVWIEVIGWDGKQIEALQPEAHVQEREDDSASLTKHSHTQLTSSRRKLR